MPTTTTANVLLQPDTAELRFLPEGVYDLGGGRVSWVAIQHGADAVIGSLNIFDYATRSNRTVQLPGRPGFAFPTSDRQKFLVGCEREILICDTEGGPSETLIGGVDADVEGTIINDAVIHGDSLIFGTKDLQFKEQKAGLYLYRGSTGRLIKLAGGQICSNGKAVRTAPGGGLELLDIDTPTQELAVYQLDLDAGKISDRRVAIDFHDEPGFPDGMIVSPDGKSVFVSLYNVDDVAAGQTRQYDLASGECIAIFATPGSPQNTCPQLCRFGDGVYLVITTAVEHMPQEKLHRNPQSGCLFYAPTDLDQAGDCPVWPSGG